MVPGVQLGAQFLDSDPSDGGYFCFRYKRRIPKNGQLSTERQWKQI